MQVFVKEELEGIRITMVLLATYSEGAKWWIKDDVLKALKVGIDVEHTKNMLESVGRRPRAPQATSLHD